PDAGRRIADDESLYVRDFHRRLSSERVIALARGTGPATISPHPTRRSSSQTCCKSNKALTGRDEFSFEGQASMMRSLLPLQWLRAYETAARHRNFSAAAAELGLTPAAVS